MCPLNILRSFRVTEYLHCIFWNVLPKRHTLYILSLRQSWHSSWGPRSTIENVLVCHLFPNLVHSLTLWDFSGPGGLLWEQRWVQFQEWRRNGSGFGDEDRVSLFHAFNKYMSAYYVLGVIGELRTSKGHRRSPVLRGVYAPERVVGGWLRKCLIQYR